MAMQTVVKVLAAAAAFPAAAAVFPSDSGDLASAEDWGGTLPGETESILVSNGTYTASADATFGTLERHYNTMNGDNTMEIDLTEHPGVTLSFAGFRPHNKDISSPSMTNWFRGGTYDFQSKTLSFDKNLSGGWANSSNQRLVFTDGAVATNISGMTLYGTSSTGSGVWLDGSAMYNDGTLMLSGYGQDAQAEMLVSGGGCYAGKKTVFLSDGVASAARKDTVFFTGNHLVVSGSGSRFSGTPSGAANGAVQTGANGEYILVTDNAYFSGKVYFGTGNYHCTNSWMRVEKGARADIPEIRLSANSVEGLCNNRFEAVDGAVVSNTITYVGGYLNSNNPDGTPGCTLFVSNATFVARDVFIGTGANGSNSTVIVSGENANFEHVAVQASDYTMFQGAEHCLFLVENGADVPWPYLSALSYNSSVSNCTVRAATGGRLRRAGNLSTVSEREHACAGNRLEAVSGGRLEISLTLEITGDACVLAVSNGTVTAGSLTAGRKVFDTVAATNNLVLLQGETPSVTVTNGAFAVCNASRVRYELPDAGYAAGFAPVSVSGAVTWEEGCPLEIANAAAAANAALEADLGSIVLIEAASIDIPEAVLSAAQAQIGDAGVLSVTPSGGVSRLRIKLPKGLVLLVM